ncbi:hypothetical protein EDC01DRAFT_656925 [Geopyxis carbonaria]|nr:hypothetical protein EDC01DRAFT_656925 [Geopyxis carbonaria]
MSIRHESYLSCLMFFCLLSPLLAHHLFDRLYPSFPTQYQHQDIEPTILLSFSLFQLFLSTITCQKDRQHHEACDVLTTTSCCLHLMGCFRGSLSYVSLPNSIPSHNVLTWCRVLFSLVWICPIELCLHENFASVQNSTTSSPVLHFMFQVSRLFLLAYPVLHH